MSKVQMHQLLALVTQRKKALTDKLTGIYHLFQKQDLFIGLLKAYKPLTESADQNAIKHVPDEMKKVTTNVADLIKSTKEDFIAGIDAVASQDIGNTKCFADLSAALDGQTLTLTGVPATHLLYLESCMKSVRSMIEKAPILDPSENWETNPTTNESKTSPTISYRTQKMTKHITVVPATTEHPAQVIATNDDVQTHRIETTNFSGALTQARKVTLLARIQALSDAIVVARQKANNTEVEQIKEGLAIYQFIFG